MNQSTVPARYRQKGVITIFVAMVMLILITLLVATAFSLSTTNLRAVSNVQARDGAIASANFVIEQMVGEDFLNVASMVRVDAPVDLDGDGVADFLVNAPAPVCVRATVTSTQASSSVTLPGFSALGAWNTVWEIRATATETSTGASVDVLQAIRVLLSDAEKTLVCPDP